MFRALWRDPTPSPLPGGGSERLLAGPRLRESVVGFVGEGGERGFGTFKAGRVKHKQLLRERGVQGWGGRAMSLSSATHGAPERLQGAPASTAVCVCVCVCERETHTLTPAGGGSERLLAGPRLRESGGGRHPLEGRVEEGVLRPDVGRQMGATSGKYTRLCWGM